MCNLKQFLPIAMFVGWSQKVNMVVCEDDSHGDTSLNICIYVIFLWDDDSFLVKNPDWKIPVWLWGPFSNKLCFLPTWCV